MKPGGRGRSAPSTKLPPFVSCYFDIRVKLWFFWMTYLPLTYELCLLMKLLDELA